MVTVYMGYDHKHGGRVAVKLRPALGYAGR